MQTDGVKFFPSKHHQVTKVSNTLPWEKVVSFNWGVVAGKRVQLRKYITEDRRYEKWECYRIWCGMWWWLILFRSRIEAQISVNC